jgi:hypothetical protein
MTKTRTGFKGNRHAILLTELLSYIVQHVPRDIGGSASTRRAPSVNHLQRSPAEKILNQLGNTKYDSRQFASLSTCLWFLPLIPAIELHHKHSLFGPHISRLKLEADLHKNLLLLLCTVHIDPQPCPLMAIRTHEVRTLLLGQGCVPMVSIYLSYIYHIFS